MKTELEHRLRASGIIIKSIGKDTISCKVNKQTSHDTLQYLTFLQHTYHKPLTIEWVDNKRFQQDTLNLGTSQQEAPLTLLKTSSVLIELSDTLSKHYLEGCSDIHFEPHEQFIRILTRKQGVLTIVKEWPIEWQLRLENILRIKANLTHINHHIPLNGQLPHTVVNQTIYCRISMLPTSYGANIVIRFHTPDNLQKFNFDPLVQTQFAQKVLQATAGLWLITSPIGNGKTTHYYYLLHLLQAQQRIFSFEDPIEIPQTNIFQIEFEPTTLNSLWSKLILRQSVNVIGLGEIRSSEQLKFVVNSALTGHCTLATLHACSLNDVPHRLQLFGYSLSQQQNFLRGILFQQWEHQGPERHLSIQEKLYP